VAWRGVSDNRNGWRRAERAERNGERVGAINHPYLCNLILSPKENEEEVADKGER
jgi:hypothetical protein